MMPLWASSASGLTSATTSGISGSRRKARGVVDHDAAGGGEARRPRARGRRAGGEDRDVEALDRLLGQRLHDQAALELAAGRALGGERDDLARRGSRARAACASITVPDGAGGADDGDAEAHGLNGCSGRTSSAPSSKASCSARTACGHAVGRHDAGDLDRRGGDHLDVDVLVAERGEHLGGDARVRLHSRADDRDLPHRRVLGDAEDADLGRPPGRAPRGRSGGRRAGR